MTSPALAAAPAVAEVAPAWNHPSSSSSRRAPAPYSSADCAATKVHAVAAPRGRPGAMPAAPSEPEGKHPPRRRWPTTADLAATRAQRQGWTYPVGCCGKRNDRNEKVKMETGWTMGRIFNMLKGLKQKERVEAMEA